MCHLIVIRRRIQRLTFVTTRVVVHDTEVLTHLGWCARCWPIVVPLFEEDANDVEAMASIKDYLVPLPVHADDASGVEIDVRL